MQEEVARLARALEEGDATAFIPHADACAENGHYAAEELCYLAGEITGAADWAVAYLAGALYLTILQTPEEDYRRSQ